MNTALVMMTNAGVDADDGHDAVSAMLAGINSVDMS